MSPVLRVALAVLLVVIVGFAGSRSGEPHRSGVRTPGGADYRLIDGAAAGRVLPAGTQAAGFTFAPGTSASDQALFTSVVAAARPQVQSLIAIVDGLADVSFGPVRAGSVGVTSSDGSGRYRVRIDLAGVAAHHGPRGVSRVVLHELAHVVDFAIVPDSLRATLDASIPPCPGGLPPAECADPEERFAEAFAKWATGDIGLDLYLGYRVPPPFPLATWGAPIAALAGV